MVSSIRRFTDGSLFRLLEVLAKPTDVLLKNLQKFYREKFNLELTSEELQEAYYSMLFFVEAQIAYYFLRTQHD